MTDYLDLNNLILPLATASIALGAFPTPPKLFADLAYNEWFQWLLMYILIWQGGAAQRPDIALVATAIVFLAYKVLSGSYISLQCPTTGASSSVTP